MTKQTLSWECKISCLIFKNQCNSVYQQTEEEKLYDYLNRCRRNISQKSTSIHDKNSWRSRNRGNFLILIKGIYKNPTVSIILKDKCLNAVPLRLQTTIRFNIMPIKVPVGYFAKTDKLILKAKWIGKRIKILKISIIWKSRKLENSHYLISILTIKLLG